MPAASNRFFNLEQSNKKYNTEIDYYMDLADRFLEGFRATVFSPNAMKCSQRGRAAALDWNRTIMNYMSPNPRGGYEAYVFNMTRIISNSTADAFGECYTTGFNLY